MKRVIGLFLTAVLLMGLCGCSGEMEMDAVRGDIIDQNDSQNENQNEEQNDIQNDNEDDSQNKEEPEFSLGKTSNNTYNNEFLGIRCTLPAEWSFYTDEEILELNNITEEIVDEDVVERLKEANIIYDMYAANEEDGSNININLEKLNAVQMIGLDIKQSLEEQTDEIKTAYQNMGFTDINIQYQKIKVSGKEFDGLKISAETQGIDFYSTVFVSKKGQYLANVTLSSLLTDQTDTILSYFTVQ